MGTQLEIEGFIEKYSMNMMILKVIITGGDSNYLSGKIKNTIFTTSNYVFKGLEYLIEVTNNMNKISLLFIVLFIQFGFAQKSSYSPYSYFGVGETNFSATADNKMMGGLLFIQTVFM